MKKLFRFLTLGIGIMAISLAFQVEGSQPWLSGIGGVLVAIYVLISE